MDNVSKSVRSRTMSKIKSANSFPEILMGKMLCAAGIRGYRKHWRVLGKPDFAWPGRKIALFMDGCFWHGCSRCCRMPTSNQTYWSSKIARNKERDRRTTRTLRCLGWAVIRVRECDVAKAKFIPKVNHLLERR